MTNTAMQGPAKSEPCIADSDIKFFLKKKIDLFCQKKKLVYLCKTR